MAVSDWTLAQREALQWLAENRRALSADHQTIWNFHEPSWREYRSSRWYMDRLEREGFTVERGTAGMPTAFIAEYGSGAPVIGILAEYDALPELSQQVAGARKPVDGRTAGHGCGHCALGTAAGHRRPTVPMLCRSSSRSAHGRAVSFGRVPSFTAHAEVPA